MFSVIESLFNHQNVAISLYQALIQILCTLLLMWAFKKYLYPAFIEYLDKREVFVNESVEKIKSDKQKTEESYLLIEQEREQLKNSKKKILDDAYVDAKNQSIDLIDSSKEQAKELLRRGQEQLEIEKASARVELEAEVLDIVSQVSKRFIADNLSEDKEAKMIEDAISQVVNG